jgi:hypothetical protein
MNKTKLKNKITQSISALVIVAILVPTLFLAKPQPAEAQFTDFVNAALTGIGNAFSFVTKYATKAGLKIDIKKELKGLLAETKTIIAKKIIAEMTKSTIVWINSGFHGQPLFVENSTAFFEDIRKSEVKRLVDQIGYDRLKFPFGKQFALQAIESYRTTAQQNAQYSLSGVINDPDLLDNYRNNFYVGGWDGFLLNTQYAQNNPMGFNLTEAARLGEKLAGTQQTAVEKVKDTLQQGMGFLSPKTCPSNSKYNNGINEFNRPSFTFKYTGPKAPTVDVTKPETKTAYNNWQAEYSRQRLSAYEEWSETNVCPGGLTSTTPGSVIADKAMAAFKAPEKQGEIAQMTGKALAAIFDSLFYKLIDDGLNSFKKQTNPQPEPDDWNYGGVTLGSPTGTINGYNDPFGGPDEEIILDKFKKQLDGYTTVLNTDGTIKDILVGDVGGGIYTPGDIENTKTEIEMFDNSDSTNPGIVQLLQLIPKQVQILDQCIPGPDKGWEQRLEEERDRVINSKLMTETGSSDYLKVKAVNGVMRDLKFAVATFKEWLTTKIITALPDSVIFIDAVKENEDIPQQIKESADEKRAKANTLARLKALKISLSSFTKQPVSTDADFTSQEKKLIAIRKQYNAMQASISSATSVEDTRSALNTLKERLSNLNELNTQCKEERTAAGWGSVDTTGNGNSILQGAGNKTYTLKVTDAQGILGNLLNTSFTTAGTEVDEFCLLPIHSGYSHGDIIRPDDSNGHGALKFTFRNLNNEGGSPGYEDVPIVNAQNIYGDDTKKFNPVDVDISCKYIHKANLTNYTDSGDPSF